MTTIIQPDTHSDDLEAIARMEADAVRDANYNAEIQAFIDEKVAKEKAPAWVTRSLNAYSITTIASFTVASIVQTMDTVINHPSIYGDSILPLLFMFIVAIGNIVLIATWNNVVRKTKRELAYDTAGKQEKGIHTALLRLFTAPFQLSGTDIAGRLCYILLFGAVVFLSTLFSGFFLGVFTFIVINYALVLIGFGIEAVSTYKAERSAGWSDCAGKF